MNYPIEKLLWSIAIPGFGQLLNGRYLKGLILIGLEFVINVNSHLNEAIMFSFQGDTTEALGTTNFQWLMFYPCVYMYGLWDAYRDAGGGKMALSYIPFVLPAYFGTVGIVYSPYCKVMGYLVGPVWLPMLMAVIGVFLGVSLQHFLAPRFSHILDE